MIVGSREAGATVAGLRRQSIRDTVVYVGLAEDAAAGLRRAPGVTIADRAQSILRAQLLLC